MAPSVRNSTLRFRAATQPTSTAKTATGSRRQESAGWYHLAEASNGDEAIAIASKMPGARYGSIEVRPIVMFS
jgi:hypothetical protein